MTVISTVCLLGLLSQEGWSSPAAGESSAARLLTLQQGAPHEMPDVQEEPQEPGLEESAGVDFIGVDRIQLSLVGGVLFFSSDFEADPAFVGGVSLRAPLPWLCREVMDLPDDDIGMFAGLRFSSVERDLEPPIDDDSGLVVLADAGLDYVLYREEDWTLMARAGIQYGRFGGVEGLENGFAALVGVDVAAGVTEGIQITLAPQVSFGDAGDFLVIVQAGVLIEF